MSAGYSVSLVYFLLAGTVDGRIICCNIVSLCQSIATSEMVHVKSASGHVSESREQHSSKYISELHIANYKR